MSNDQDQTTPTTIRPEPTKTEAIYRRRGRTLIKRAIAELEPELGHLPEPDQLVSWLIKCKPNLVATSFRQYKASLIATFKSSIRRHREEASTAVLLNGRTAIILLEAALQRLAAEPQTGCKQKTCLTSSQKAKRMPNADQQAIETTLRGTTSKYRDVLIDYLIASVRTGLRPQEWNGVTILQDDDDGFVLRVLNLKHNKSRAHGESRTLRFVKLPPNDRAAILRWMQAATAAEVEGRLAKLLCGIGSLLARTDRLLWPRRKQHYTLYSPRHEFAALAKLVYMPEEVAALMGHATDLTATSHYGRYRRGTKIPPDLQLQIDMLPLPAPNEVARVRHRLASSLARLKESEHVQHHTPG